MPPRRTVAPSPARSTRSTRSRRGEEDEWENESVQSAFKALTSRGKGNNIIGLSNTSVNVAAAFHAAQTGSYPTPTSAHAPLPARSKAPSKSPLPSSALLSPPPASHSFGNSNTNPGINGTRPNRAQSPAEQLANSARALSPVRFFLRETNPDEEYNSFSSIGGAGDLSSKSAETSYDYRVEEEFVRKAAAARSPNTSSASFTGNGNGNGNGNGKEGKKQPRRSKGRDEDMPYRPAEDDWQLGTDDSGSDGEGDGQGIVRGGALDGRAGTRGTRREKGEGYLGMGLGLQPRRRTKRGQGEDQDLHDGLGEAFDDGRSREATPVPSHIGEDDRRRYRSPTPVQLITRALTPSRTDREKTTRPRDRRQPPTWRTVVTNLLHGLALALRYIVEAVIALGNALLFRPFRAIFGSTKQLGRIVKGNWWKWALGGLLGMIMVRLAVSGLTAAPTSRPAHDGDIDPRSMEHVFGRLGQLEKAVEALSESSGLLASAEHEGSKVDAGLLRRIADIESSFNGQVARLSSEANGRGDAAVKLQSAFDELKHDVDGLGRRVGVTEDGLKSAEERFGMIDRDVKALRTRMDEVEARFKAVIDDGRLRAALDRVLPEYMSVRKTSEGMSIDPTFWAEMRKVFVPRTDGEKMVKEAIAGNVALKDSDGKTHKQLEKWADMIFEKKAREHTWTSRAEFEDLLEVEIGKLKHLIAGLPRQTTASPPPKAQVIKSAKGDDITSLLTDLIDAALLKYSKDTIARPDYALFTAGARVIPSITSDTFVLSSPGWFGRNVLGRRVVEGRSPATALVPDISVGSCWPFGAADGDGAQKGQGQLGILLNRRVVVSDLTVEHASRDVALDVGTAPRDIEVWGVVEGAENQAKVAEYQERHPSKDPASPPPSPEHLLLASFTYDPSSPSHIQTFPVDNEIVEMGIDVGVVVFKVLGNWGGGFTCLYRVRVHGQAVEV